MKLQFNCFLFMAPLVSPALHFMCGKWHDNRLPLLGIFPSRQGFLVARACSPGLFNKLTHGLHHRPITCLSLLTCLSFLRLLPFGFLGFLGRRLLFLRWTCRFKFLVLGPLEFFLQSLGCCKLGFPQRVNCLLIWRWDLHRKIPWSGRWCDCTGCLGWSCLTIEGPFLPSLNLTCPLVVSLFPTMLLLPKMPCVFLPQEICCGKDYWKLKQYQYQPSRTFHTLATFSLKNLRP